MHCGIDPPIINILLFVMRCVHSVSALVGLQGQLSDLVTFDLRANLHDTLIDAMKGKRSNLSQSSARTFAKECPFSDW